MVKKLKKKLTQEQLEYLRGQPSHRKKRLLKDPCWPSTESPECVKLMIKSNPWMLEKGGDKYVEKVVGKKSLINKEIKKKKSKKNQNGGSHNLRFATLMGQSISLHVENGERVEEIKDKLSKKLFNGDIPPKYIRLIYRGIVFDGDKIIAVIAHF